VRPSLAAYLLGAVLALWAGAVLAISFMEAPLKFTAPGITLPLGVGIGRIVFHALQKLEWALALLSLALLLRYWPPVATRLLLMTVGTIVLLQAVWLLPALDVRAGQLQSQPQVPLPPSYLHLVFVVLEATKTCLLLIATIRIGISIAHAPRP
jgi:hypothetical protein